MIGIEKRMAGGVKIGLEETVGFVEVFFFNMPCSAGKEITAQQIHLFCVAPTVFVFAVKGIERLGDEVQTANEREKLCRVVLLLQIEFLVRGLILTLNGFIPSEVDARVLPVDRIVE